LTYGQRAAGGLQECLPVGARCEGALNSAASLFIRVVESTYCCTLPTVVRTINAELIAINLIDFIPFLRTHVLENRSSFPGRKRPGGRMRTERSCSGCLPIYVGYEWRRPLAYVNHGVLSCWCCGSLGELLLCAAMPLFQHACFSACRVFWG